MDGALYIFGDIHGCSRAFDRILEDCGPTASDTVILLGDVIDRGPDSRGVLQHIVELEQTCATHLILGNHEEMLLSALHGYQTQGWLRHGGLETLESYGGQFSDIPDAHLELLHDALPWWEGPHDICIHANLEPGVPLAEQDGDWLRWKKFTGREPPHPSGKRIVCGHTICPGGVPFVRNGWVCLDTQAYRGGFLTCLAAHTGEILQASEAGRFRRGAFLSDLE